METRQLGTSDLFVTPVGLGCWPIAGITSLDVNEEDSLATVAAALDAGINFLDTAYMYGYNGESERLIGQVIRSHRDEVVLASKAGIHWNAEGKQQRNARPERIAQECDESLLRLGIDAIDLYYLHAPDPDVPITESAGAISRLLEAGKIRAAGASNCDVGQLADFQAVCPLAAVQPAYNMLQRDIEADIIPWCLKHKISVVNYWPLMKGLLAGKIRRGHSFDPNDKRLSYEVFQEPMFECAQKLLDVLDQIAIQTDKTVAQIVTNWTLHRPGITSTLCGAKRSWQIEETSGAMGWKLDDQHLDKIEAFSTLAQD